MVARLGLAWSGDLLSVHTSENGTNLVDDGMGCAFTFCSCNHWPSELDYDHQAQYRIVSIQAHCDQGHLADGRLCSQELVSLQTKVLEVYTPAHLISTDPISYEHPATDHPGPPNMDSRKSGW